MNYTNNGIGPSSSPSTKHYAAALRKAQMKFKTIAKNADNPAFRSKYATFDGASEALLPPLTDEGFCLPTYHPGYFGSEMGWCCLAVLEHAESGEWKSALIPLINEPEERKDHKTGGVKTLAPNMQGFGKALSYAKRQALLAVTGAWVGEVDTDGGPDEPEFRQAPVRKAEPTKAIQQLQLEQGWKKSIADSADRATAVNVMKTVELRLREKAIDRACYDRCKAEFTKCWDTKEVVSNG